MAKSAPLSRGRWWRFSRYQLRNGCLCPAPDAKLRSYDPWKMWLATRPIGARSEQGELVTPYRSLLGVLERLEYRDHVADQVDFTPAQVDMLAGPLTGQSERAVLNWCKTYGLLGVLPHRVSQVVLCPQSPELQMQYIRIGAGWTGIERDGRNPQTPHMKPGALIQTLRGTGFSSEPISTNWARFFPSVPRDQQGTFGYPQPLTEAFWKLYAEPLEDFLSAARKLREVLSAFASQRSAKLRAFHAALTGGLPIDLEGLIVPGGFNVELEKHGRVRLKWITGTLLASLTLMMLEDLAHGRALQCPCGQLIISKAYQARYCSRSCRWRFEKRESRRTS